MADRDPELPANARRSMARAALRRMVALVEAKATDGAEGPLPLHKSVYTGEKRYAAEREHLFLGQPIVAGLSGDIPNPGDLLVFDAAGPSILVMRGKDGAARAFLNMCTHRGAKLVEAAEPHAEHRARVTCPFHAWTFATDGKLIGQPSKASFAACEIGARSLIELPCAEHLGLIFVRPGGGGEIDAAAHLGDLSKVLAALELHRAVPVKKGVLTADSNWKFALDTYGEGYHFATLHASTIGQTHYSDIASIERFGRHHRIGFPDNSIGELVGKPESEWPAADYGGVHFLFPNTVLFFGAVVPGSFFTQVFRLFPDGPGKTRCQFAVYAPFGVESEEHRAMCEMAYDATATVVQTEDYRVASNGYANLLTAPADFHVVLGANEAALQAVHRHIAEAIGMAARGDRMNEMSKVVRDDRCPGPSYTDMLDADTRRVPDFLFAESNQELGDAPLSTERYTSSAFKALEDEKMWPNVWQFAAREEDMPEPGDTVVYELNDKSFLLVRQRDGGIRAFHNVCLHRGRKLRLESGPAINLRCPFHGFTWNNDGSLKEIPCQWDFPHLADKDMPLPELKVERWQGFVLVSENPDLPPFRDWIGPGVEHYDRWRLDECHTGAWIGRVIPANWKAVSEAFMEAWHSVVTHPQILGFTADANTRYDLYGDHMNRAITPSAALSPHLKGKDQMYVMSSLADFLGGKDADARSRRSTADVTEALKGFAADDPWLARKVLAQASRESFTAANGHDYSDASDSEMLDNFTYNIFPNWAPWGGFTPNIVYRWRPWGDADHCLMEVRILQRTPKGEKPPNTEPMFLIGPDEPFSVAAHLIGGALANVFDQDMANLPYVQQGMKASANKRLELGSYQESRVRHFHATLDKYIDGQLPA